MSIFTFALGLIMGCGIFFFGFYVGYNAYSNRRPISLPVVKKEEKKIEVQSPDHKFEEKDEFKKPEWWG